MWTSKMPQPVVLLKMCPEASILTKEYAKLTLNHLVIPLYIQSLPRRKPKLVKVPSKFQEHHQMYFEAPQHFKNDLVREQPVSKSQAIIKLHAAMSLRAGGGRRSP